MERLESFEAPSEESIEEKSIEGLAEHLQAFFDENPDELDSILTADEIEKDVGQLVDDPFDEERALRVMNFFMRTRDDLGSIPGAEVAAEAAARLYGRIAEENAEEAA